MKFTTSQNLPLSRHIGLDLCADCTEIANEEYVEIFVMTFRTSAHDVDSVCLGSGAC